MSRGARTLTALGLVIIFIGLVVALVVHDRFLGIGLFVVGTFLIVLPFSRPSLDED